LDEIIRREHLEGLIGRTHQLILQSLIERKKTYTELFNEIEGQDYITSQWQVVRATDQLQRIGCVKAVGTKKTGFMAMPTENIFTITNNGKRLLERLNT
jgi:DNA-binding PadR family transcriptional regulator